MVHIMLTISVPLYFKHNIVYWILILKSRLLPTETRHRTEVTFDHSDILSMNRRSFLWSWAQVNASDSALDSSLEQFRWVVFHSRSLQGFSAVKNSDFHTLIFSTCLLQNVQQIYRINRRWWCFGGFRIWLERNKADHRIWVTEGEISFNEDSIQWEGINWEWSQEES